MSTDRPGPDPRTSDPLFEWLGRLADRAIAEVRPQAPTGRAATVARRDVQRRPSAHLSRFAVTRGDESVNVMVKARPPELAGRFPTPRGDWALFMGPSWVPAPPFERRTALEFEALRTIDEHFREFGDARFSTVAPIAFESSLHAFAMEEKESDPLDQLLADSGSESAVRPLLEGAGAWLAQYHALSPETATTHHDTRAQVVEALRLTASKLPASFAPASPIHELCERTIEWIERQLPETLPTGLTHGDFWSGNVLVDGSGAVAVIDTFAASRTPIYEDLAYFTFHLKAGTSPSAPFRVSDRALAREQQFLSGYFADGEIPLATLRVFELCVLIRKWAGRCHRCAQRSGLKRIWKRARLNRQARVFRAIADRLFESLEEQREERHATFAGANAEVRDGA